MEQKPLVSIVVPVYNVEQYLAQCLDSLIGQTYKNIEIICVDDGSPDNSIDILNDYADRDKRVRIIRKQNGGASEARNYGLEYVTGEYFMFIDADDWLDNCTIEKALSALKDNDADCVMFSYIKEFDSTSVPVNIFSGGSKLWYKSEIRENLLRRTFGPIGKELRRPQDCDITVSACMQLYRTDKFRHVKFFDDRKLGTFEDGVYQIDIYSQCDKFVYIDCPLYHYRKTNSSSITTKYNPQLPQRWKKLFEVLSDKASKYAEDSYELNTFTVALNNRIALAILPLGLNEIRAEKKIRGKRDQLSALLRDDVYCGPLSQLELKSLSTPWKFLFFAAKREYATALTIFLSSIEYLRTHIQR